jgi:hypothetical protein
VSRGRVPIVRLRRAGQADPRRKIDSEPDLA